MLKLTNYTTIVSAEKASLGQGPNNRKKLKMLERRRVNADASTSLNLIHRRSAYWADARVKELFMHQYTQCEDKPDCAV